jgi:hypothetical protein
MAEPPAQPPTEDEVSVQEMKQALEDKALNVRVIDGAIRMSRSRTSTEFTKFRELCPSGLPN